MTERAASPITPVNGKVSSSPGRQWHVQGNPSGGSTVSFSSHTLPDFCLLHARCASFPSTSLLLADDAQALCPGLCLHISLAGCLGRLTDFGSSGALVVAHRSWSCAQNPCVVVVCSCWGAGMGMWMTMSPTMALLF